MALAEIEHGMEAEKNHERQEQPHGCAKIDDDLVEGESAFDFLFHM